MKWRALSWRLRLRHALDLEREGDILDHRAPGKGRFFLEHHADRRMRSGDAFARDRDLALIIAEQSADDIEQGRLAAAGRADHRQKLALPHRQRDIVDRGHDAFRRRKVLGDVLHDQDVVRHSGAEAGRMGRWQRTFNRPCAVEGSGHGRSIARFDPHIDHCDIAAFDRGDCGFQRRRKLALAVHRTEALRALRARHRGEIDIGIGDALADPAVLDRPVAHAGDALLMQFVVEEGAVVGNHHQQRNAVMRRGPERGDAHQIVAVAADRDRQPAGAFQRERRADRNAGAAADAAAAVGAEIVERMAERPPGAVPGQRQMREGDIARARRPDARHRRDARP